MPRPKALQVSWENVFRYGMQSTGTRPAIGDGFNVVGREERLSLKLKVPLYLSDSWKLLLGFQYENEDFVFSRKASDPGYALHQGLHDHNLKRIGTSLYLTKAWRGNRYFGMKLGADLNGDYGADRLPLSRYLRISVSPMLGWKVGEDVFLGGGLSYNHTLGRPSLMPFLVYNHTFNERWGIETILPARARVRMNINESSLLYAGFRFDGASYAIHAEVPDLPGQENFQLRISELRFTASIEREIHDFLWFEVEAGVRTDLRFDLTEDKRIQPEVYISSERRAAPFVRAGIFLVPPERWMKK